LFDKRDWQAARKLLEPLRDHDGPAKFLLDQMSEFLRDRPNDQQQPPGDWDGAFRLKKK